MSIDMNIYKLLTKVKHYNNNRNFKNLQDYSFVTSVIKFLRAVSWECNIVCGAKRINVHLNKDKNTCQAIRNINTNAQNMI